MEPKRKAWPTWPTWVTGPAVAFTLALSVGALLVLAGRFGGFSSISTDGSLLIDTPTCALEDVEVEAPTAVAAGEAFTIALVPVLADDDQRDRLRDGPCWARVDVRGPEGLYIDAGATGQVMDLMAPDTQVTVVIRDSGSARFVVSVTSAEPCARCRASAEQQVDLNVEADPARLRMQRRLQAILDQVEVELVQDEPLDVGRDDGLIVVLRCRDCGQVPPGGLTLKANADPDGVLSFDLTRVIEGPEVDFEEREDKIVHLTTEGDSSAEVALSAVGVVDGRDVDVPGSRVVKIDGRDPNRLERIADTLGPPGLVMTALATIVGSSTAVLAFVPSARRRARSIRRRIAARLRRPGDLDDPPDVPPEDAVL